MMSCMHKTCCMLILFSAHFETRREGKSTRFKPPSQSNDDKDDELRKMARRRAKESASGKVGGEGRGEKSEKTPAESKAGGEAKDGEIGSSAEVREVIEIARKMGLVS